MFSGLVAAPAMVVLRQLGLRWTQISLFIDPVSCLENSKINIYTSRVSQYHGFWILLQIQLNFFDPGRSSTSSSISCSDKRCKAGIQTSDASCSSQNNQCSYSFQYGDGSGTSGYYVSDMLHLDTISEGSVTSNSSAPVVFGWVFFAWDGCYLIAFLFLQVCWFNLGKHFFVELSSCSNQQSGDLTKSDRAVDGIFGFGQQEMSVISQLSSQGIAPRVFSHCLKGDSSGGGILVLGEIVEPNIVYTPLVPLQ